MLTAAELARYNRQLLLPELGLDGQERLRTARVLVIGAGGLGSPVLLYLAAAGVGTLGIADSDSVDASNLHRQILHGTEDIGRAKSESAAMAIRRLNPLVIVHAHQERVDGRRAESLVAEYDLVVDGSDNYPTRYAINDACAARGIPWIYGSVERFSGQVSVFCAPGGPCYRCIFPEPPSAGSTASCDEIGVLGAVPGVIGALQATEALKWIAGIGEPLVGRLLQLDFLSGQTQWMRFGRRTGCVACGDDRRPEMAEPPAQDLPPFDVQPEEAASLLRRRSGLTLLDIREQWEVSRARIESAEVIPLNELENNMESLDRSTELIVFCHHGSRSRMATEWLRSLGFRARNLAGGIDRWSREIDPGVPRY